ncbi:MAG: hypothetical protein NZ739_10125 [Verrucomicrobiae bacterium]|nr:hypothetical protein [Verrucomicrobiae bacterium]
MREYYLLYPTTMNPCTLERRFYEEARKAWLCPGCGSPRCHIQGLEVLIQEDKPDNAALNGITGTSLGLAKKNCITRFGDKILSKYFELGKVYGPNGVMLEEWVVFVGKHQVIVRGTEHVKLRQCPACGRNIYFGVGQRYLYPAPPQDVLVMDGSNGLLVVADELLPPLELCTWPKVKCVKLPVLDVPLDGLVDLKSVY